jgi:endonuclease/exonuclease/phosphatase family metal-dependent hydrolase
MNLRKLTAPCLRTALLASLCIGLALPAASQSLDDLSFGESGEFSAISWNLEWFPKNGQSTLDSVAAAILALDADVYALQEISDTAQFMDWAETLEGYEGLHAVGWFGGLTYLVKSSTVQVDNLYEILSTSEFWSPLPRSPLILEIHFDGQPLVLINNHFKCCGDGNLDLNDDGDEETRRWIASNLLKEQLDENYADIPVLLMGDLNDVLTDPASDNVFQAFLDDPEHYTFADMELAQGPSAGWSFPNWPSHIDHLLVNHFWDSPYADYTVLTIAIEDHLEGGWWAYDENMSDHRPVGIRGILVLDLDELHNTRGASNCKTWSDKCIDATGRRVDCRQPRGLVFQQCETTPKYRCVLGGILLGHSE